MKRVVFLGPPGVGKGTQAAFFARERDVTHIATGDMLRSAAAAGTPVGLRAREFMDAGNLVPDDVMLGIVEERLAQADCVDRGFLLDGFPRTLHQAEGLSALLDRLGKKLDGVVRFTASNEVIAERIAGRLSCKCGATYHRVNNPPRKDGVCDACGEELFVRPDDNDEAVRVRLATYRADTQPLVAYYGERGLLRDIRADRPVEDIRRDVALL